MSAMYGKLRVVLSQRLTHFSGNSPRYLVVVCGSDTPSAIRPGVNSGNYAPLGYWYKENGLFYVDLKSREQWFTTVNPDTIANKRLGGALTKGAIRTIVLAYWKAAQ
jgi:hypothetical protein